MKKLVYLAALLGVAAGSFAFLPKAEEPTGYMMVIGHCTGSLSCFITTTSQNGQQETTSIDARGNNTEKMLLLHKAETLKINELRQQGWQLIQVSNLSVGTAYFETVYTLEKK